MDTDIIKILNDFADKGLPYFALYIVYHYTSQVIGAGVLLVLAKSIMKIIDNWMQQYLDIKRNKK